MHTTIQYLFDAPDGEFICSFTIPGRPATKKTSQRIVKRGKSIKILPSERYMAYELHCQQYVNAAWKNLDLPPLPFGVGVKLKVFLNSWVVGDETGYQQAIGDILEKHELISNDMMIHWYDDENTHMIGNIDKENPRVEITLIRYRHPKENTPIFKFEDSDDECPKPVRKPRKKPVVKKRKK